MSDRELVARAISYDGRPWAKQLAIADRALAALRTAGRLRVEVTGEMVEAAARELVPFSYGAFELQRDENGERVQPPGQPNALAILAVVAVSKILTAHGER